MRLFLGWRAMARPLVPDAFEVPERFTGAAFRLERLREEHNADDFSAWTCDIEHVRSTPGFVGWDWPPPDGMSLDENLRSVRRHAAHFAARVGFTYAVLDETDHVVGCVYIYPAADAAHDCEVRSWVRADRSSLDEPVHSAVLDWLDRDWPFDAVLSHPRS